MFEGSLVNRLTPFLRAIVLVAAIDQIAVTGVPVHAAPPPSHQDILEELEAVETAIGSKLDQIQIPPPPWSRVIPLASDRFTPALGGAAVLDKETGLVWDQSPFTIPFPWAGAHLSCTSKVVGGRIGWRLPLLQELASLVDPTNPDGNPDLPLDHPFSGVQSARYWSATIGLTGPAPANAWGVSFDEGGPFVAATADFNYVLCVRGGQGVNPLP
jgi:hypothetical protein